MRFSPAGFWPPPERWMEEIIPDIFCDMPPLIDYHAIASIYGRLTHIWDKFDYHTWVNLLLYADEYMH